MSYLFTYIPITLVILVVLETLRQDSPVSIIKRSLLNFTILTAILIGCSAIVFFLNKYL